MKTVIVAIAIDPRSKVAPTVQKILTKYGCIIKTRLGLHETSDDACSERGLILLQIPADADRISELKHELLSIDGIAVNSMTI